MDLWTVLVYNKILILIGQKMFMAFFQRFFYMLEILCVREHAFKSERFTAGVAEWI